MKLNELTVGRVFAGDFRVIRPLEVGGMGAIYEVEQLSTGTTRALKLMLPEIVSSPKQRERFDREARAAGRIESDHVVQVVSAGVDAESQTPWLAMELLKGEHLDSYVRRLGPQSPDKCDAIFGQMCHAIAAAHRVGIVHRDLKPENVFISPSRIESTPYFVKVLDFGIARITELAKTKRTDAAGTPLWMAPEQTTSGAEIGPPTDVWALGLIGFWLLTGRYYWVSANDADANAFAVVRELLSDDLESASARARRLGCDIQLPANFDAWFARCVNREPSRRFVDAAELRAQLPAALGLAGPTRGISSVAPPTPTTSATPPAAAVGGDAGTAAYLAAAGLPNMASPTATVVAEPAAATPLPRTQLGHTPPQPPHLPQPLLSPERTQPTPAATHPGMTPPPVGGGRSKAPLWTALAVTAAIALGGLLWWRQRPSDEQRCLADNPEGSTSAHVEACARACEQHPGAACAALGDARLANLETNPDDAGAVVEAYAAACDADDPVSCRKLGALYQRGNNAAMAPSSDKAMTLLTKACDGSDGRGCTLLGVEHDYMRGSDRDVTRVMALYEKGCKQHDALGCAYAAMLLYSGRGLHKDAARATKLAGDSLAALERGCDEGDMAECSALGTLLGWGLGTPRDHTRAATMYQTACEHGYGVACNNLGVVYARGDGVMQKTARAAADLKRACKLQSPAGCNNLGAMDAPYRVVPKLGVQGATVLKHRCERELRTGCTMMGKATDISPDRETDAEAAARAYGKGCEGGEPHACVNLGGMKLYGRGTDYDKKAAMTLFTQACDAGNPSGCGELGALYTSIGPLRDVRKGNELMDRACAWGETDACVARAWNYKEGIGQKNPHKAAEIVRKTCDEGSVFGCYVLGVLLDEGAGVKKNAAAAFKRQVDTCNKGHDSACVQMATFYLRGVATKRDIAKGVKILEQTCKQGNYDGCVLLAQQLVSGKGAAKDTARANALLQTSCDQHHGYACHELGFNYFVGNRGVDKDLNKATELLTRACDYNIALSCFNLGLVLVDGIHVKRDIERGKEYLRIACDAAHEPACKKLKTVR